MSQSPELAGGEGFTFEGDAAAYYLAALLAEAYAPGINDRIVVRVSVQQRDFGEPLDDVIVDFEDAARNPTRLSLQVKRSLTISKARTNKDFREVVRDSWATLVKADFRIGIDRYGAIFEKLRIAVHKFEKPSHQSVPFANFSRWMEFPLELFEGPHALDVIIQVRRCSKV